MKTILVWYLISMGTGLSKYKPINGVHYSPPMPDVEACVALQKVVRETSQEVKTRCVQIPVVILNN